MIVAVDGVRCAHPARNIAWENFPVPMYYLTYRKEKVLFCRFCCYASCLRACRNGGAPLP